MSKFLTVLLSSLVITIGFSACSKQAEETEMQAKEAVTEMKATTIDAAK